MSPSNGGGSKRITSAPQSARVRTQDGPARASVRSITLKRDNGSADACADTAALADVSAGLCMAGGLMILLDRNNVRRVDLEPDFLADIEHMERRRGDAQLEAAGLGLERVVPGLA